MSTESKALDIVRKCLESKGYAVKRARPGMGCDFVCTRQRRTTYVEVKGSSKRRPPFRYFTQREYAKARQYRNRYQVYIVTGIGTHEVNCYGFTGNELVAAAHPEVVWRVDIRFED